MFYNNKGSTTIECLIIVPIIVTLVVSFIMIMITVYQYNVKVLKGTHDYMAEDKKIQVTETIRGIGFKREIQKTYDVIIIDARGLQNFIEFMIYESKKYSDYLEGIHE